jgi:hypothetical protein
MTLKNKIYFIIFITLEFIGLLFFLGFTATRSLEAADNNSDWMKASPIAWRFFWEAFEIAERRP